MKTGRLCFSIYCIILSICCFFQNRVLHAADAASSEKKRVAVLEINTNNVPASYGNIARNSFEVLLFNSDKFQLLDRERLQVVAAKMGILPDSQTSMDELLKLGKNLSADYLISGTIDKLDTYKITVRVISVHSGEILTMNTQSFSSIETFEATLNIITTKIKNDILEYIRFGKIQKPFFEQHSFSADAHISYLVPFSNLKNLIKPGPGVNASCVISNIFLDADYTGLHAGFYRFEGRKTSSDNARFLMILLAYGYEYPVFKWLYVKGEIEGGINLITLSHGTGKGFTMQDNTQENSFDPLSKIGAKIGISPLNNVHAEAGVAYGINFEKDGNFHFINLSIGLSITF
jgi:hypothetical protein